MDHRDFQQLARGQRRQNRGQARRQHALARTRRAAHQQIVPASRGDLQRPLGALLPLDVAQVRHGGPSRPHGGRRARHDLRTLEMVGELDQGAGRENVEVGGGPRGLGPAIEGADQPLPPRIGGHRRWQGARHGGDGAVQSQLADDRVALERVMGDGADGGHDPQRDGQVVMTALLGHVGGGEVDGDAPGGQGEARGGEGRAHPLARFRHRLVAKAHHAEAHLAVRNLHLHIDWPRLDALKCDCCDPYHHGQTPKLPKANSGT